MWQIPLILSVVEGSRPGSVLNSAPPPLSRAIAFGKDVPFLLSPRGEEGTQRVSDGKVRGSFRRRVCFRKQRESCAPPSPSHACGAGPPERLSKGLSPMGRGDIGASVKFDSPAHEGRVGVGGSRRLCDVIV